MLVLEKRLIVFLIELIQKKNAIPRTDAITIIKSNTFHGIVKYLIFNAINFMTHSAANLNYDIIKLNKSVVLMTDTIFCNLI